MGRIVNRSELSDILGVDLKTVDQWLRRGCPYVQKPEIKGGSGWKIDVGAVLSWHREQERKNALGDVAQIDEGEAKRRKLAAEAALAEHELAMKQGAAVSISDACQVWDRQISAARSKFLGAGHKLAPLVAVESNPLDCQALIDEAVHEALAELSRFDPGELRNSPAGLGEVSQELPADRKSLGATSEAHSQRMGRPKTKTKPRVKRRSRAVENESS